MSSRVSAGWFHGRDHDDLRSRLLQDLIQQSVAGSSTAVTSSRDLIPYRVTVATTSGWGRDLTEGSSILFATRS